MDNLMNYFLSRYWVHHWCILYFLQYAVSLCNVLPTIGQYSIDIIIKCITLSVRMPWKPLSLTIGRTCFDVKSFRNWSSMHSVNKLLCIVLITCGNKCISKCVNTVYGHTCRQLLQIQMLFHIALGFHFEMNIKVS